LLKICCAALKPLAVTSQELESDAPSPVLIRRPFHCGAADSLAIAAEPSQIVRHIEAGASLEPMLVGKSGMGAEIVGDRQVVLKGHKPVVAGTDVVGRQHGNAGKGEGLQLVRVVKLAYFQRVDRSKADQTGGAGAPRRAHVGRHERAVHVENIAIDIFDL
jgi:hypothetical protein